MIFKLLFCYLLVILIFEELFEGVFYNMIDEIDDIVVDKVECVVFCSGKVYYELL